MLNHITENEYRYAALDDGNARRRASTDSLYFFEIYGYSMPLV